MNIWQVKHKIDKNIMMIDKDFDSNSKSVFFKGEGLSETWVVPDAYLNPKQPGAALVNFPFFAYGSLLCDSPAWNIIQPFVQNEVEPLPVNVKGYDYRLLNPIQVIDCLDKQKSVCRYSNTGRVTDIDHYVLDDTRIGDVFLFKMPERIRTYIYCTEAFRQLILDHQLTGLEFLPLP